MTGYGASVWNRPEVRLLVVAPNWLGDGVMAMPALQELRARLHPQAVLHLACKPGQTGLWQMHGAPSRIHALPSAARNLPQQARLLREEAYTHAVLLPNSFRSALAPFLAGIPRRRGTADPLRRLLVNDPVRLPRLPEEHQQWENARLLLGECPAQLPPPRLHPPAAATAEAASLLQALPTPRLALIPGAARGPAKRWPGDRFAAVAAGWIAARGGAVVWLGTAEDHSLCAELGQALPGAQQVNLAGRTSLSVFAALLAGCDAVVANDSGGMHLAAAVGTPVAAIFGLTNPAKTGPLHPQAAVLQHAARVDRAIARDSTEARAALEAVTADEVLERVLAFPPSAR